MSVGAYVSNSRGQLIPQEFATGPQGTVVYRAVAKLSVSSCQTLGVVRIVRKADSAGRERWMTTRDGIEDPRVEPWWLIIGHTTNLGGRFRLVVNQDFEFYHLEYHDNEVEEKDLADALAIDETPSKPLSEFDRLVIEKSILHHIKHHGLK